MVNEPSVFELSRFEVFRFQVSKYMLGKKGSLFLTGKSLTDNSIRKLGDKDCVKCKSLFFLEQIRQYVKMSSAEIFTQRPAEYFIFLNCQNLYCHDSHKNQEIDGV